MPVNVPSFTIPFEIGGSAQTIRDVELLVSQDRGRRWSSAARQPVETGKFAFRADADGEYWFAFRTITLTGEASSVTGHPELRVLVDTKNPMMVSPFQQSETGAVMPPKPERYRPENRLKTQPMQPMKTEEWATGELESEAKPERINAEKPTQMLAPRFPGFDLPEPGKNSGGDFVNDLLNEMSPFLDVQPVVARKTLNHAVATDVSRSQTDTPAGIITGIDLNQPEKDQSDARPRIIVKWHPGHELWRDAQIDVLRSGTLEGQWSPIAINLPNSGEYWWYLSPEDLKPFYIAVRIRSFRGGSSVDVTQKRIEIDPRLAALPSQK